jgi:putative ABC transport system permease protein
MSLWRQLTHGLRVLTGRDAADREVSDEIAHYRDQAAAEHRARGLAPHDARRAARLETGGDLMVREEVRAYGWENVVSTFFADLRHGARQLRRAPGFTTITVLTLALGIGATTTIFSAVNPVLFRSLPLPHADRIVTIWDAGDGGVHQAGTFATFTELDARNHTFDAIAVMKPWQPTITGSGEPERLEGQRVSAGYFRVLGVPPAIGRELTASDDRLHGPAVVILSDGLWRRRFNADLAIVGKPITLDDSSYMVIGVMPAGFVNVPAPDASLWTPLQYDMTEGRAWGHHLHTIGRLRAGASVELARQDLNGIARSLVVKQPQAFGHPAQGVTPLQEEITRGVRPALFAVLGAVILVLIIACVNVMNLLLARGVQRQGEFAMRAALGAGRTRMLRQLLTESLLLAMLGGAAGLMVAQFGVRAIVALSPPGLPMASAIAVDGPVFLFGFALTAIVSFAFGLIPALRVARSGLQGGLQDASRRTAGGHQMVRRSLVVAEVALALVLLVASGLMLRTLERFFSVAPGFEPSRVITMQVQVVGRRYDQDSAAYLLFGRMLEAARAVPGVTSAAFTSQLPLSGDDDVYGVHLEADPAPDQDGQAFRYAVSPGYFETMGIPLRRGRLLDARDRAGAPRAVLINESYAHRKYPGIDPLGRRVHVGPTDQPWYTIVGIVGDVKQLSLAASLSDAIYMPPEQSWFADRTLTLVARTRSDPAAIAPAIRAAIWSVDKDQPIVRVATMEELLSRSGAERRFAMVLFTAFAIVALVLAAAGIYGVLSGSVTERTREIGVRAALGASRSEIRNLILRQGMTLAAMGALIGVIGAIAASRVLVTMLFGISRLDPVTYVGVIALLMAVAAMACWLPAWRAARVDPGITLRAE